MTDANTTEADDAPPTEGERTFARYMNIVDQYDREYRSWEDRCEKIIKIYTERRRVTETGQRRMSLLWSNISTLQPSLYAKMPEPNVNRRFKDDDPVGRQASELLERCIRFSFDDGDLDLVMRSARDDFLLTGRATAWVRYDADFEAITNEAGEPVNEQGEPLEDGAEDEAAEKIAGERVEYDYVNWRDFGHNVARNWQEVTCVWRKVYMSRAQLKKRFGADKAALVSLDHKVTKDTSTGDAGNGAAKATVYELWCKETGKVYFLAKGAKEPLEVSEPYLKLKGFFPCPRPAYGTIETASLVPIPDYVFYQDQVEEIDELTARIGALTDSLKVAGFYPSGASDVTSALEKIFKPGVDNCLIPVPNWAMFKEGGGAGGNIEWFPVDIVIKVLESCFVTRKQLIEDVYQITGISDIMRGEADHNETATAQNLKSQWGSVRIRDKQHAIARFARDLARLAGEIMADKFQPETLLAMSNLKLPTQAEVEQRAMQQKIAQLQQMQQQPPQPQLPPPGAMAPQGAPMPQGMPS